VLRLQETVRFQSLGRRLCPAQSLIPSRGYTWMGWGVAYRARLARRVGMLMAVWAAAQEQPGVVSTDVPPERAGLCWYRLQV
jgi:hypothetical protein